MHARALSYLVLAGVLAMLAGACGGGRGVLVQTPTTLAAGTTVQHTEWAILDALSKRRWTVESVQPGRVLAFLSYHKLLLRIEIRYDLQQIAIYYLDSVNLSAAVDSDGRLYAHKRVNAWLRRLSLDIGTAMAMGPAPATAGGVAPLPPPGPVAPAPTAPAPSPNTPAPAR